MLIAQQHGHLRPDMVWKTGVIEPYPIAQRNPVDVARGTIDPFIYGIRPPGPFIAEPAPEHVANAAVAVANEFAKGRKALVVANGKTVKVGEGDQPVAGLAGVIAEAARQLRRQGHATIRSQGRTATVQMAPPPSRVGMPMSVVASGWAPAHNATNTVAALQQRFSAVERFVPVAAPNNPSSPAYAAAQSSLPFQRGGGVMATDVQNSVMAQVMAMTGRGL